MSSLTSDATAAEAEAAKQARYVHTYTHEPVYVYNPVSAPPLLTPRPILTYLHTHTHTHSIKVNPEDVKFIVSELEVTEDKAELTLKQQGENVVEALRKLLH
jgi:NACalpha-BTF3-like transcription factor